MNFHNYEHFYICENQKIEQKPIRLIFNNFKLVEVVFWRFSQKVEVLEQNAQLQSF